MRSGRWESPDDFAAFPPPLERNHSLVVFARAPEIGRVKTRLAAELGADAALSIYRALAGLVVEAVQQAASYSVTIAYTPENAGRSMREWLGTSVSLTPQGSGDLGARMAAAAGATLRDGAARVVLIGTDCPDITSAVVEEAFVRLDAADVVVGPAADGGYYLIGMSRPHPGLFEDVPWSAPDTLEVTRRRARSIGLTVSLLEERRDVDTADDWRAWLARSGQSDGAAR